MCCLVLFDFYLVVLLRFVGLFCVLLVIGGGGDVALALLLSRSAFNWLGLLLIVIGWFSSWVC